MECGLYGRPSRGVGLGLGTCAVVELECGGVELEGSVGGDWS